MVADGWPGFVIMGIESLDSHGAALNPYLFILSASWSSCWDNFLENVIIALVDFYLIFITLIHLSTCREVDEGPWVAAVFFKTLVH